MQYAQDYDERLTCGSDDRNGAGWAGAIYPYVKSSQIYTCPSDTSIPAANMTTVSYGYNINIGGAYSSSAPTNMASWTATARTILLFELRGNSTNVTSPSEAGSTTLSIAGDGTNLSNSATQCCTSASVGGAQFDTGYMDNYNGGYQDSAWLTQWPTNPVGRHLEGANYLMADGHVKWLRPSNVSAGNSAPTSTSAQYSNTSGSPSYGHAEGADVGTHAVTFSLK